MLLRRMLESAVDWDYLPANPFSGRKKVKLPSSSTEQKGRALDPDEIRRILNGCRNLIRGAILQRNTKAGNIHFLAAIIVNSQQKWRRFSDLDAAEDYLNDLRTSSTDENGWIECIVATAILTGMRSGELFGLPWENVDFETNQIHVRRPLYWRFGRYWAEDQHGAVFVTPKSKNSIRAIDMSPRLRVMLLEHRMRCGNPRSGLVFSTRAGGPLDPKTFLRRQFHSALKAAGLGKLRFHDLSDTFGSLKLEQGENSKYVQLQMGHSDVRITINTYAHLFKGTNPEAAAKTDSLIFEVC